MALRPLGRSGLQVSEFALGAMTFGMDDWGCDEATATELVHRYLDAGGNLVDTANMYGPSEDILGRALRSRRDQALVSTKFGLPFGRSANDRGAGRIHVRSACESSLRRLQTDRIDLFWVHVDDPVTPLEETLSALDDLVREGKVLYVGLSNYRAYRVMQALAVSDRLGTVRPVAFQGQYNLIARGLEREHFGLFAEQGLGLVSWSPLAAGMLTGKVSPHSTADTRLSQREVAADSLVKNERGFEVAALVKKAAAEVGCSPAQLALAWQRTKPVTSVIIGARTMAQLDDNLAALDVVIPPEVLAELDGATTPTPEYPGAFIDIFQAWMRGSMATVAR